MKIINFTVDPRPDAAPICKLNLSMFNSGNRDSALQRAVLKQGKTTEKVTEREYNRSGDYLTYGAQGDFPGLTLHVIKGGEIQFISVVFPACNPDVIRSNFHEKGFSDIVLKTESLNYEGELSVTNTLVATVTESKDGKLQLNMLLEGSFNLLSNNAEYSGKVTGRNQIWYRGAGKRWEEGYDISDSYSHPYAPSE